MEEGDSRLVRFLTLLALLVVLPVVGTIAGAASGSGLLAVLGGVALALGLGLFLAICLAGLIARTNRVVLVATFAPLLVLTNVALVPLIAISGFIAAVAVGFIFPIAGGLMGLGALVGVVVMLNRSLSFPFVRGGVGTVRGIVLTRDAQPRLWQAVEELAARIRITAPQHLVVGLEPNFFVTQGRTTCIEPAEIATSTDGKPDSAGAGAEEGGRTAGGMLRSNKAQWDPAFGDDDADDDDDDDRASRRRKKKGEKGEDDEVREEEVAARLSRTRELAADRVSVEATDEQTTAAALVKIHGFHRYWRRALVVLRERIRAAEQGLNASADFAAVAHAERESPWMRRDLDEEEPPHPIDSHPPLSRRLAALRSSMPEVAERAFTVQPPEPAIALFEDPEPLERRLTLVEKAILVETRQAIEGASAY